MITNDFNDRPAHKGFPDPTPEVASAPTWKRFSDAPPPDGFYWVRRQEEKYQKTNFYEIVEVGTDRVFFHGTDVTLPFTEVSHEYYSQPILPPV